MTNSRNVKTMLIKTTPLVVHVVHVLKIIIHCTPIETMAER